MDPSPKQSISSSFAVEGGEEDKEVMENHVGRRQLLPLQTRVSQGKGGEEDIFDQSFIDAGNNTFHQPSQQLPYTSTINDIASQPCMTNVDNDGFSNNAFDSFDPFFVCYLRTANFVKQR
jgi:hypothetical protein